MSLDELVAAIIQETESKPSFIECARDGLALNKTSAHTAFHIHRLNIERSIRSLIEDYTFGANFDQ